MVTIRAVTQRKNIWKPLNISVVSHQRAIKIDLPKHYVTYDMTRRGSRAERSWELSPHRTNV